MADLNINTINDFDVNGVFPLRTIQVGEKQVQTPTVVHRPHKRRDKESINSASRGVAELYVKAGGDDLDTAIRSAGGQKLTQAFRKQQERVTEEEIAIPVTRYTETATLSPAHAEHLAEAHATFGDIVTVPWMPSLVNSIDVAAGITDAAYQSFKQSVTAFLTHLHEHHPDIPVMGLIPNLGWEFVEDLLDFYNSHEHRVSGYMVDFDRKPITADAQVSWLQPMMNHITNLGLEENTLLYALNLKPGRNTEALDARPVEDLSAIGLGFDIIGGRHLSPNYPPEVFESDIGETRIFRLFDRKEWVYRDIEVDDIAEELPDSSMIKPARIDNRVGSDDRNYRLENIVNGELKALELAELRRHLEVGEGYKFIAHKKGITQRDLDVLEDVREGFDGGCEQTSLDEF